MTMFILPNFNPKALQNSSEQWSIRLIPKLTNQMAAQSFHWGISSSVLYFFSNGKKFEPNNNSALEEGQKDSHLVCPITLRDFKDSREQVLDHMQMETSGLRDPLQFVSRSQVKPQYCSSQKPNLCTLHTSLKTGSSIILLAVLHGRLCIPGYL